MYISQERVFALVRNTRMKGTPFYAKVIRVNDEHVHIKVWAIIDRLIQTCAFLLPIERLSEVLEADNP